MNQCENYLCQVVKTSPWYGKDVYGQLSGVTVCIIEWNYRAVDFEVESQGNFARFLVEYKLVSSVDIVKEHSEKSNVPKDTSHSFFWIASVVSSSIKESCRYPNWKADWRPFWIDSCHNKKLNHDKRKIFQRVLMSTLKIICLWSFIGNTLGIQGYHEIAKIQCERFFYCMIAYHMPHILFYDARSW